MERKRRMSCVKISTDPSLIILILINGSFNRCIIIYYWLQVKLPLTSSLSSSTSILFMTGRRLSAGQLTSFSQALVNSPLLSSSTDTSSKTKGTKDGNIMLYVINADCLLSIRIALILEFLSHQVEFYSIAQWNDWQNRVKLYLMVQKLKVHVIPNRE